MKTILSLFAVLILISIGCSDSEEKDKPIENECITNKDCKKNFKCELETNKCIATEDNEITDIEMEFTQNGDTKELNMIIGAEATIKVYGIFNNDNDNQENITIKSRCKAVPSTVGTLTQDVTNRNLVFLAKTVGITEISCKYTGVESEHLKVTVNEAVISSIDLSSPVTSLYLHQSIELTVLGILDGGENIDLADRVTYHSIPEGIISTDRTISFPTVGTYKVWTELDGKKSNEIDLEVKENVVESLNIFYEGTFEKNVAKKLQVEEIYKGNGKNLLETTDGLTFVVNIVTPGDGDDQDTETLATDTDYSIDGFMLTLKTANKFNIIVSKTYTEEKKDFVYVVIE